VVCGRLGEGGAVRKRLKRRIGIKYVE